MNEQEMQAQFIQWLAKKTGAKTEQELQQILMKLQSNPKEMEQTMQAFQSEMAGSAPTMMDGGKFSYIKCLESFKQGGIVNCGCIKKGEKGIKATSQANNGAKKSPKYPALKPNVSSFTEKEIKNIPGWETKTTPMRIHKEGGILLAGRGEKLQARSEKLRTKTIDSYTPGKTNSLTRKLERSERISDRGDAAGERQLKRRDRQLVNEFNNQGTETSPGVFQRGRNRFDQANEANIAARKPLGITDNTHPDRNKNADIDTWNRYNSNILPNFESKSNYADLVPQRPFGTTPEPLQETPALLSAPKLVPKSVVSSTPVRRAQVNPMNIKGATSLQPAIPQSPTQNSIGINAVPLSPVNQPKVLGEVEVLGKMPIQKQAGINRVPAPATQGALSRNGLIRASMNARGTDMWNDGTIENTIKAAATNQVTFSPIGGGLAKTYNSFNTPATPISTEPKLVNRAPIK